METRYTSKFAISFSRSPTILYAMRIGSVRSYHARMNNFEYFSPRRPAVILAMYLFGLLQVDLAASNRDQVPPSPEKQWSPPNLAGYKDSLQKRSMEALEKGSELVDLRKEYTLPDLIDLAQQLNPATRAAWQNARQALALVGVSKSAYYPFLSLAAAAGYTRFFVPFPKFEVNQAALRRVLASGGPVKTAVTLTEGNPLHFDVLYQSELTMKWLLFDFGQRDATVSAAREGLLIANVAFNATHQRVVLEVSQSFYAYNLARESVKVAESAFQTADTVHSAVEARVKTGLATEPDLLQAKQQFAQAQFDLEKARGSERDALVDLMEAIGLSPAVKIRITEGFTGSVGVDLETPLVTLITRALSQRPDLVASLAKLRAAEDKIKGVKASYFPKITALASVDYGEERTSLGSSNTFDSSAPTFGASLAFELPIFDGFLRDRSLQAARAEQQAASEQLEQTRDDAVRQVWKSYTDLRTAVRRGAAAAALLQSSQSAYDAVLASFKLGLSTYTDVVTNETKLTSAHNAVFETQSAIYQAADTLHRLEPLLPKAFATREQVDEARTKVASLDAEVAQADEKLNQARVALSSLATLQAQRPGAVAALGTAQLELSYTRIYAPFDGEVVGLNLSEGAYAHAGVEVFSFLDSRKWYVLANFRERELQSIRPGMRAEIYLLSDLDRRFQGIVQGISPAVQSQEDNVEIKGLPFAKRDLNWVRIAQRFPVRIEIENPDPGICRMGTTAVTTIVGFTPPPGRN
jgi:outer membrane protein